MSAVRSASPDLGGSKRGRPRWVLPALIIALVLGAVAIYALVQATRTQTPRTPIVVGQFSGDGDESTASFTVQEGWQIHWETTGEAFSFAVTGDEDLGTLVNQDGPGTGITAPVGSGTFHLEVTAEGPWTIEITQGTE